MYKHYRYPIPTYIQDGNKCELEDNPKQIGWTVSEQLKGYLNPLKVASHVPEAMVNSLLCFMCGKFSFRKVYECKDHGHLLCELCFVATGSSSGCQFLFNPDEHCCSEILNNSCSQILNRIVKSMVQFHCLNPSCPELIGVGDPWKQHLDTCPLLKKLTYCHFEHCGGIEVAKNEFLNHCKEVHGKCVVYVEPYEWIDILLDGGTCESPLNIASVLVCRDQVIYVVFKGTEDNQFRLTAFMLNWDAQFAEGHELKVMTWGDDDDDEDQLLAANLKLHPSEMDMADAVRFDRSATIPGGSIDKETGKYSFELAVKGYNEKPKNSDWTLGPVPKAKNTEKPHKPVRKDLGDGIKTYVVDKQARDMSPEINGVVCPNLTRLCILKEPIKPFMRECQEEVSKIIGRRKPSSRK